MLLPVLLGIALQFTSGCSEITLVVVVLVTVEVMGEGLTTVEVVVGFVSIVFEVTVVVVVVPPVVVEVVLEVVPGAIPAVKVCVPPCVVVVLPCVVVVVVCPTLPVRLAKHVSPFQ